MKAPEENREFDVIVVGAGIAGPAIASGFGKQGRSVLVVERDLKEPDRIVGELLQPGGMRALKKLGLESCVEGIDAVEVDGYEVIYCGKPVHIPYPLLDPQAPEGPRVKGRSFHHGRFVSNLRKAAQGTKNVEFLEASVTQVITNPCTNHVLGVKTVDRSGTERHYFAKLTVMSDGIQSKFRKDYTSKRPVIKSHFAGLILEDADLPAPKHGHVIIGKSHQPILVYQVGTHETRILCDIAGKIPSNGNGDLKRHLETNIMPHLPKAIQPSFEKALDTQRIRTMAAQFLPAGVTQTVGLVLLGDALNIRHPLTGGGMTVALNDAVLLLDLLRPELVPDLANAQAVDRQLHKFFWQRKQLGSVINVLAQALYSLFAGSDENLEILRKGCFKYFELGGSCIDGPVSLLAGVLPRPFVLFCHFFQVAFYAIFLNLFDHGIVGFPKAFLQMFTVIWTACVVFLPMMWEEVKWW